jgi:hypothetical protein
MPKRFKCSRGWWKLTWRACSSAKLEPDPSVLPPPPLSFLFLYLTLSVVPWKYQESMTLKSYPMTTLFPDTFTPSNVQLCNSTRSTRVYIILREVQLSWRGARDQGGGDTTPLLNTCRPSIKGCTYKSTKVHTHTPYQSILISKVKFENNQKSKNQWECIYFIDWMLK